MRAALDRQASAQIDMALGQRVIGPDDHLHLLAVVREVVVVLHLAAVRLAERGSEAGGAVPKGGWARTNRW